jgi:hypothetical protein
MDFPLYSNLKKITSSVYLAAGDLALGFVPSNAWITTPGEKDLTVNEVGALWPLYRLIHLRRDVAAIPSR